MAYLIVFNVIILQKIVTFVTYGAWDTKNKIKPTVFGI